MGALHIAEIRTASRFLTIPLHATTPAVSLFPPSLHRSSSRPLGPTTRPPFRRHRYVSARPLDANGSRGAVELRPRRISLLGCAHNRRFGRGPTRSGKRADHDATTIELTGDPHVGIIVKGNIALNTIFSATNITDTYVPFGAHTVHVTDATHIHAGDLVQITKPVTAAWIKYMGMDSLERPDRDEHWISATALNVRRLVTAVSGNAVTFQIALMDSYDSQFLGTEHFTVEPVAVSGQVKEVGVEDLRIVAPAATVDFHDAHSIAMEIDAAADSWVRNVAMIDTTEGIRMDNNSERITLTRVDVEQSTTVTSAARPFDFAINGTQVLVDRATGTGDKVTYFATEPRQQGPVVILNSVFHGEATWNLTNAGPLDCWWTTAPSQAAAFTSSTAARWAPAMAGRSAGALCGTAPQAISSSSRRPAPSPGPWAIAVRLKARVCRTIMVAEYTVLRFPQASSNLRASRLLRRASTSPS